MAGIGIAAARCCLKSVLAVLIIFAGLIPHPAWADWSPLIDRLVRDGGDAKAIADLFARPEARFDPGPMSYKMEELIRQQSRKITPEQQARIKAMYDRFLNPDLIERAAAFAGENQAALNTVRIRYCVPQEIVVAIMLVETELGRKTGTRMAFNTLASMALAADLDMIRPHLAGDLLTASNEEYARRQCREKSDWAYRELRSLIRYAQENRIDPLKIPGSVYGAIGLCQFMPSNVSPYGVDADGDGRIDLFTTQDALHSVGKYLHSHGWKCNLNRRGRYRIIMAYNRSPIYANTVLDIAEKLRNRTGVEGTGGGQAD